jgi:hypothetical protein
MVRIADRGEEAGVAERAADVFRRAGPLAAHARGVPLVRLGAEDVLDDDLVLPPVAEVVGVQKPATLRTHRVQPHVELVAQGQLTVRVGLAVLHALDVEGMQVAILPTHRELDDAVQPVERVSTRHEDSPPHRRHDVRQRHLQLKDLTRHGWHCPPFLASALP